MYLVVQVVSLVGLALLWVVEEPLQVVVVVSLLWLLLKLWSSKK
jgi:hypothetical protein